LVATTTVSVALHIFFLHLAVFESNATTAGISTI